MGYSLGFDGGGTKTDCVVLDSDGSVVGEGQGGPSNALRIGFDDAFRSISAAAAEALKHAGLHSADITSVCAGLAGAAQCGPADDGLPCPRVPTRDGACHYRL